MTHFFEVEDAIKHGVEAAVVLAHIKFWLRKNMAGGENYRDGRTWTYCSGKALEKLFPYMTRRTIARTLERLERSGEVVSGNYNQNTYDQTKWYAVPDEAALGLDKMAHSIGQNGQWIGQNGQWIGQNGQWIGQNGQPIPDKSTDISIKNNTPLPPASGGGGGEQQDSAQLSQQDDTAQLSQQDDTEKTNGAGPPRHSNTPAHTITAPGHQKGRTGHPTQPEIVEKTLPVLFASGAIDADLARSWGEWVAFRMSGPKVKSCETMFARQAKWLSGFGNAIAIEILDQSIRNGWRGLFEPKGFGSKPPPCHTASNIRSLIK